jgi:hypothetical protein
MALNHETEILREYQSQYKDLQRIYRNVENPLTNIRALLSPSLPISFPSATPPTTAAPEDPRPRPSGMGLTM